MSATSRLPASLDISALTGGIESETIAAAGPPAAAALNLDISVVTERAAFDALEAEWNALFERAGRSTHVFQTFNWCWHWCRHYLPANGSVSLAVVVARRNGRLAMVWPLVRRRIGVLRQLSWLGEPVSQYGDILVEPGAAKRDLIAAGWAFIGDVLAPDVVWLRKVRADAEVAPLLSELGAIRSDESEAPFLDLLSAPDCATYEERFTAKSRRNRRRLQRRLEERGRIEIAVAPAGNEARFAAGIAVAMKRCWLEARGMISPAVDDRRLPAFFQDVAEASTRFPGCRVSLMTCNGETAGAQITVACKGRLALHVIAYSLAFEKAGVGVLHLESTLRAAFDDGYDTIDLLAPKADYKMDWADGTVAVADHAVALSLAGRAYARGYLGFARERLKRAIEHLSARLRGRGAATPGARGRNTAG